MTDDLSSRHGIADLNDAARLFQVHVIAASSVRMFDVNSVSREVANAVTIDIDFNDLTSTRGGDRSSDRHVEVVAVSCTFLVILY